MLHHYESLLIRLRQCLTRPARTLVALAGAPGSGKSTLTERLQRDLGEASTIVPMDGYHFDNAILDARGWRPVKGAPHTFDAEGMRVTLERLRQDSGEVYVPVFDRERDLARAGARCVTPAHRLVLVEGNYLLLDRAPWRALHGCFDIRVFLDVPLETLEERLMRRWLELGMDPDTASGKVRANDLPNARLVTEHSVVDAGVRVLSEPGMPGG